MQGVFEQAWGHDVWILTKLFFVSAFVHVFFQWIETKSRSIKTQKGKRPVSSHLGVILGAKTCEVFLCFLAIILAIISLSSIVLTSHWLLCINCFASLVRFTGFYTEYEPYLDRTSSVNSKSIYYTAKKITFSCGPNVENPQRARW